jgi:hypothetical protein
MNHEVSNHGIENKYNFFDRKIYNLVQKRRERYVEITNRVDGSLYVEISHRMDGSSIHCFYRG